VGKTEKHVFLATSNEKVKETGIGIRTMKKKEESRSTKCPPTSPPRDGPEKLKRVTTATKGKKTPDMEITLQQRRSKGIIGVETISPEIVGLKTAKGPSKMGPSLLRVGHFDYRFAEGGASS